MLQKMQPLNLPHTWPLTLTSELGTEKIVAFQELSS